MLILCLGLFSLYLSKSGFNFKGDERECKISIHDWALWINPWSKTMEHNSRDPWWVRGVVWHPLDMIFGRMKCQHTVFTKLGEEITLLIPMPEGVYGAIAKLENRTWKRTRWPFWPFKYVRDSVDINIPGGVPFQGKGENSWDCGDNGLWGIGSTGHDLSKAVATVVESVYRSRKRYGRTGDVMKVMETLELRNQKWLDQEKVVA